MIACAARAGEFAGAIAPRAEQSRRYLLVDDNLPFVDNLAEIVRDAGDEAWVAESGAQALVLLGRMRFHALVTDMCMPWMNGAELIHEARRIDPELPAIIITAYSSAAELHAASREGLLAVLVKPVPIARLLELMGRARRGAVVALLDDDEAFADNLSELLRDQGFSAVVASSHAETIHLGGARPFLALADLRLPGSAEGAAVARLRELLPLLPVFIVTGFAHQASLPQGLLVFEKPCDSAALLSAIAQLYEERAARERTI